MIQNTTGEQVDEKRRSRKDLLIWLVLIPLISGTLLCCGQLALYLIPGEPGRDTSSLLSADYHPWQYGDIVPINIDEEAFLEDIREEQGTVVVGDFWVPPTSTAGAIGQVTETPTPQGPGASNTPGTPKASTPTPTRSGSITATSGPTSTLPVTPTPPPTITNTVSPTSTLPAPPSPPAPPTDTSEPVRPTNTRTNTPLPTRTRTFTPTPPATLPPPPPPPATWTPTFTNTPATVTPITNTPSPTPTYAPVRPIAQNDGAAEQVANGGCRIFFDYQNDNPNEVDIPVGPRNNLDDPAAIANPPQPTHFLVGRVIGAFEFTWYSGLPLVWTLDGRTATAYWCY
jgi:hypothetical protein